MKHNVHLYAHCKRNNTYCEKSLFYKELQTNVDITHN